MNVKYSLGLGALTVVPITAFLLSCKPEKPKPNVIFILLDDFGYSDLGCYGSKFYETPNIDRLAIQGIKFTNAYAACPVSSPTRAAIMTGKYPVNTGITDWIPGRQATNSGSPDNRLVALPFRQQLELSEETIAEVLQKNGYRTMISGKWHLGENQMYWPEYQGFNINKGGYGAGSPVRNNKSNGYFSPYGNPRLEDGPVGEYLTDRQTDEAIKFIKDNRRNPFFVYLSYYAVHNPMQGKEDLIKRFSVKADSLGLSTLPAFTRDKGWIKKTMSENYKERIIQSNPVYAAMIYSVDENIGRLMTMLNELDLEKNTVVFFTSDNGGLSTSEGSPTCNSPLRAGKGWLYEGGIRVPLILKVPGIGKSGITTDALVSSIDYFSTIAEMTGSQPGRIKTDGISILPVLKGNKPEDRPLFWHYPHYSNQGGDPGSAIRSGRYKLIDNFEKGRLELYDLETDISESNDLSSVIPDKASELFNLLKDWRMKTNTKLMEPNPKWIGFKQ